MPARQRLVIVSEYYAPDPSTTSEIITAIAAHLAREIPVLVLSGTAGSASAGIEGRPSVVEIRKRGTEKAAILRRAVASGRDDLHGTRGVRDGVPGHRGVVTHVSIRHYHLCPFGLCALSITGVLDAISLTL